MFRGIVLVSTQFNMVERVFERLIEIPEVREAYIVYGQYDIIVIIETSSIEEFRRIVIEKIRTMEEIKATHSYVVVKYKIKQ